MPLEVSGSGVHGRRSSFRGSVYERILNGQEVIQRWPKKRDKRRMKQSQLDQMEFFRQVQWAFKYSFAQVQSSFVEAVAGTPLMPRDLFLMSVAGRAIWLQLPDGERLYPMTAVQGVSGSLDILTYQPGSMLWRGADLWQRVVGPTAPGQILYAPSVDEPPEWQDASALGGGTWNLLRTWDFAVDGLTTSFVVTLNGQSEIMAQFNDVTATVAGLRGIQVSTDGGATFRNTSGDYDEPAGSGIVANTTGIYPHATNSVAAKTCMCIIERPTGSAGPKHVMLPTRGIQSRFKQTSNPITDIRIANIVPPNISGQLSGGKILIFGR